MVDALSFVWYFFTYAFAFLAGHYIPFAGINVSLLSIIIGTTLMCSVGKILINALGGSAGRTEKDD